MVDTTCAVCKHYDGRYKCVSCKARYCCVRCYQTHKQIHDMAEVQNIDKKAGEATKPAYMSIEEPAVTIDPIATSTEKTAVTSDAVEPSTEETATAVALDPVAASTEKTTVTSNAVELSTNETATAAPDKFDEFWQDARFQALLKKNLDLNASFNRITALTEDPDLVRDEWFNTVKKADPDAKFPKAQDKVSGKWNPEKGDLAAAQLMVDLQMTDEGVADYMELIHVMVIDPDEEAKAKEQAAKEEDVIN